MQIGNSQVVPKWTWRIGKDSTLIFPGKRIMIRDLKKGTSKIERIGKIAFDLSTLTANRLVFFSKEVVKLQAAVANWLSTEHVELLKLVCRLALYGPEIDHNSEPFV